MKDKKKPDPTEMFVETCQEISNKTGSVISLTSPKGTAIVSIPKEKANIKDDRGFMNYADNPTNNTIQEFENILPLVEQTNVALGELLSKIKHCKGYTLHGYESMKDYLECEYRFSSSLASKLIGVYDIFYVQHDFPPTTLEEIGFERLCIIRGIAKKMNYADITQWIDIAAKTPIYELRRLVKEYKQSLESPNLRDIFMDQVKEMLSAHLNCEAKDLKFNMHLYFFKRYLEIENPDSINLLTHELKKYRSWFSENTISAIKDDSDVTSQEGKDGHENG